MHVTMINTLRRRRSVPAELFYSYWRDTHVGVAARLVGIDTLYTHQVQFDPAGWPSLPGVSSHLPEAQLFDGVPEPAFATASDLEAFGSAMGPLMADEVNIFERTIGYNSLGENSQTLKQSRNFAPNGQLDAAAYLLFIQRRSGIDQRDFRSGIRHMAGSFAGDDAIGKVRYHLLEPYDDTDVFLDAESGGVSHGLSAEHQHQAVIEIAFADRQAQAAFHSGDAWTKTMNDQRDLCRAIHPFAMTHTYTWKLHGRLTLAGLRGAHVVDQIGALRAMNQVDPQTLRLFTQGSGEVGNLQLE